MPRVLKKDLEAMVARLTKENEDLKNINEEMKKLQMLMVQGVLRVNASTRT